MTRRRKRPPPRVLRHLQPCPDCCATVDGDGLQHEISCPLQGGVERACDEDRAWFASHPGEWHRTRAISRAELQTLDYLGTLTPTDRPDHVHVLNAPFGRVRTFCNSDDFTSLALDADDAAS